MQALRKIYIAMLVSLLVSCGVQNREFKSLSYQIHVKLDSANHILPTSFLELGIGKNHSLFDKSWRIFFNSYKKPKIAATDSSRFGIQHLNGDTHYIYPKPGFTLSTADENLTIAIDQQYLKNISDFPIGFFLVPDTAADTYHTIQNIDPNFENITIVENKLAAELFERNTEITDIDDTEILPLLPTPQSVKSTAGTYIFSGSTAIVIDKKYKQEALFFANEIKKLTGLNLQITEDIQQEGIRLLNWALDEEAYQLKVNEKGIEINAGSSSGMFYGLQSLKNIILHQLKDGKAVLKGLEIEDKPRFEHRAFMIDVVRNFQGKEKLMQALDMMANYKINTLHFHFNDDEGWRIEIKDLPELTAFGAKRGYNKNSQLGLPPSFGSGPDLNNTFGTGYYTRQDFVDILKYAKDRHITIIPEIETPGHARAAIKSMEHRFNTYKTTDPAKAKEFLLHDAQDSSAYRTVQGWNDNALNVSLPSTYHFIEHVIKDLVSMYQEAGLNLKKIHMGGDEVPAGVWEKSPAAAQLMKQNPQIASADDLWVYFFDNVNQIFKKYDIRMHGWEEIGMKRTDVNGKKKMEIVPALKENNYLLDVWNNIYGTGAEDLAYRLANQGFQIVLSNVTHMYMDLAANSSFYEPGMFWGGYVDEEKPFYFIPENYFKTFYYDDENNPIPPTAFQTKVKPTAQGVQNIRGLQTAIWSETLTEKESFDYMVYSKLIAFAERAWSPSPSWSKIENTNEFNKAYKNAWNYFNNQLYKVELKKLSKYYADIAYRIPNPGVKIQDGSLYANARNKELELYYTIDSHIPTHKDTKYTEPLTKKGLYRFKAYDPQTKRYSRMIVVNFE